MKFFALIMAFLVLVLSIMPCADQNEAANDNKVKTGFAKTTSHPDGQQPDDCSPFCHCTCCAGFSVNHFIAAINNISLYHGSLTTSFLSSEIIGIALPIWQPPQLV